MATFDAPLVSPAARRLGRPLAHVVGAAAVLILLGRQLGAGPFRDGLGAVTLPALVLAVALVAVTTACSAWRWHLVARALGIEIRRSAAVGAYYRSQFLNSVLPGGVVGDVHRAVAHGRRTGEVGGALRAVGWEKFAGQVVQGAVTVVVLLALPSPVHRGVTSLLAAVLIFAGCGVLATRGGLRRAGPRSRLVVGAVLVDLRRLTAHRVWPWLFLTSLAVVGGHTTTFVVASRLAGCTAPTGELVALAMLVQTATVVPLSVGGWGPREGVAAWAFASTGFSAATGVAATTVYGVMALAAVVPGAWLLLVDGASSLRRRADRG